MGKVLFLKSATLMKGMLRQKLSERIDSDFMSVQLDEVRKTVAAGGISLIVVYFKDVTDEERVEITKVLTTVTTVPFVLVGTRDDLHKYFAGDAAAKILRYLKTPILLSSFLEEIQTILVKLGEAVPEEKIAKKEILEKEQPKHVLVVDDDPIVLRTINNTLKELFRVSVAKSGAAAISFLAKEHPDLILLDYEMPVCNGLQTLEMIRAEEAYKDIPVFFLTGVDDADLVKRAMSLKPEGYILKSAGPTVLIKKIEAFF